MDEQFASGSSKEAELELLALVIESYERSKVQPISPDPIEAILFRMDQQQLSKKDLVPYIGSLSKVSEVISRKRPLSLSMIRKLHMGLNIPAEVLIGGSGDEDVDLSSEPQYNYSKFPLQEMWERGYFADFTGGIKQVKEYAEDLVRKFMRGELGDRVRPALLRARLHQSGSRVMDEYALLIWRICVLKKAHSLKLTTQYKKTYLDGAAMLDDNSPIVALTLRHDRMDNFWFALMHELLHVQKHLKASHMFIADNLGDKTRSSKEEHEADQGARDALIPAIEWEKSAAKITHSPENAIALANKLRIHPAIVAGRVRYETDNWRLLNGLLGAKGEVRKNFDDQLGGSQSHTS